MFLTNENGLAELGAQQAMASSAQTAYQTYMSDTAHQREMFDLKAAGLNPVLSAKLGGASTPSGESGLGSVAGKYGMSVGQLVDVAANAAAGATAKGMFDIYHTSLFRGDSGSNSAKKESFIGSLVSDIEEFKDLYMTTLAKQNNPSPLGALGRTVYSSKMDDNKVAIAARNQYKYVSDPGYLGKALANVITNVAKTAVNKGYVTINKRK